MLHLFTIVITAKYAYTHAPTSQLRHGASWRQNKVKTGGGQC